MNSIRNEIEYRVFGVMRSGNHAVISWICGLHPGKRICFLNNVQHGNRDPFETYAERELQGYEGDASNTLIRKSRKDVLIYSYEDRAFLDSCNTDFVSSVLCGEFEEVREKYLGKSRNRFDVIIVRDPFNCFASRLALLRTRGALGGSKKMQVIKNSWKSSARRALDASRRNETGVILVKYNSWVADKRYRADLSQRLLGNRNPIYSSHDIPHYGGGSSFQESLPPPRLVARDLILKWYKIASIQRWINLRWYLSRLLQLPNQHEQFLRRWEKFKHDNDFCQLFLDNEVVELSNALFGEIPGTRMFLESVWSAASAHQHEPSR